MDRAGWAESTIGLPAVEWLGASLSASRLRILAYHDVTDAHAFRLQLEHLAAKYEVMSGENVTEIIARRGRFPERGVWITFDDGYPAVFEVAQPILSQLGLPATAYVCPGVIGTQRPFWWDVVREATEKGIIPQESDAPRSPNLLEAHLKQLSDDRRRAIVNDLASQYERLTNTHVRRRQASLSQLRAWVGSGFEIGNHSWDHPCLDTCTPSEQRQQVGVAHDWLIENLGARPTTFAYPNGNWTLATEDELRRLGYRSALGFDHRLCSRRPEPLRLSRLRIDGERRVPRLRAIMSGAHPTLLSLRSAIHRRGEKDPRRFPR